MHTEKCNADSTHNLTEIASICNDAVMVRIADIEKRLLQQHSSDVKHLKANYSEQNKLRPSVLRFRDLENDAKVREERIQRIVALIGGDEFDEIQEKMKSGDDVSSEIAIAVDMDLPLWMAIRAIVEQVSEIQVIELQHALEHFGKNNSRQAIESALASHRETFETKTRNREKFVSLKR